MCLMMIDEWAVVISWWDFSRSFQGEQAITNNNVSPIIFIVNQIINKIIIVNTYQHL